MINSNKDYVHVETQDADDKCQQLDKDEDKEVDFNQEENAITELNDVAILSSSKISLKNQQVESLNKQDSCCGRFFQRYKGSILAIVCNVMQALNAIFIKKIVNLSATDIVLIRYFVQFLLMFVVIKCKNYSLAGPKKHRKLLLFRAVIGTIGLPSIFIAYKLLDPSDAVSVVHSSIIITAVLARIFLKEKLTIAHIVAILLAAGGIFLIAKPKSLFTNQLVSFNQTNQNSTSSANTSQSTINIFIGITFALVTAVSVSTVQVALKKLTAHKVHFSIPIIFVTYVGIPVSTAVSILLVLIGFAHQNFLQKINELPMDFFYAILCGFIGTIFQVLLNISLMYEEATKIAILRSLDVFLTFFFQFIILNISVDMFSIIGSSSIILGSIIILSFKLVENKSNNDTKTNSAKKTTNCCLKVVNFKF